MGGGAIALIAGRGGCCGSALLRMWLAIFAGPAEGIAWLSRAAIAATVGAEKLVDRSVAVVAAVTSGLILRLGWGSGAGPRALRLDRVTGSPGLATPTAIRPGSELSAGFSIPPWPRLPMSVRRGGSVPKMLSCIQSGLSSVSVCLKTLAQKLDFCWE